MGGPVRKPVAAGRFYEGSAYALERAVHDCVGGYAPPDDLGEVVGGIVPHAGWMFSGPTAAKVFFTLSVKAQPEVYVFLGAVHRWGVGVSGVYDRGAWATPLGEVAVDAEVAEAILSVADGLAEASPAAHADEHSIEAQLAFVQALSPDATIVPIAVPPGDGAAPLGAVIAQVVAASAKRIVVVGSTDLTHYGMGYGVPDHGPLPGAMGWMRENDMRIVRMAEALEADGICAEAAGHYNACGAGAMAAAVSAARCFGAEAGRVLEYTTSADVLPERGADSAVGYVGMVFTR